MWRGSEVEGLFQAMLAIAGLVVVGALALQILFLPMLGAGRVAVQAHAAPTGTPPTLPGTAEVPTGTSGAPTLSVSEPLNQGKPAAAAGLDPSEVQRVFPAAARVAKRLIVADLTAFPPDLALVLISLQGIVNQREPRLYCRLQEYDQQWADWLVQRGDVEELDQRDILGSFNLIQEFRSELRGQVVVDPALPATINVATMISGLEHLLITTPTIAERYAERFDLPIVENLEGRFRSSAEAYEWAWNHLWPRLNHRLLAICHPSTTRPRDYLIQQQVWVWWQSGPVDGNEPGNSPMDELKITRRVLAESPVNIPVMGYPWSSGGLGLGERPGVSLFSRYGKFLVPTDLASNLSVHAGTQVGQTRLTPPAAPPPPPAPPSSSLPESSTSVAPVAPRVYASFIVSDGDNLQAVLNFFRKYWDSPARGQVPVGWTLGPTALDLMPDVVDYLARSLPPTDEFLCAVSGIGYAYLDEYGESLPDPEAARAGFLALTRAYMNRLGMRALWPMVSIGTVPRDTLQEYVKGIPELDAIFADYGQTVPGYSAANGWIEADGRRVPVFRALGRGRTEMIADLQAVAGQAPRPAFVHAFVFNWQHGTEELAAITRILSPDFVFVRPSELASVFQQASGG